MGKLTTLEWWILNETCDDAENLEQIYQALYPSHVLLSDMADTIRCLAERKLLVVHHDSGGQVDPNDVSYVWRAWFEPSLEGRELWSAQRSEFDSHETTKPGWDVELARRLDEIERGVAVSEPAKKVFADLKGKYS